MTNHPYTHRKLWIEKLVKDNNFTIGAELGVHEGVTHFHLLDACPNLTMIGVDIYTGKQAVFWKAINKKTKQYGARSQFYRMPTDLAANKIKDESLDFVFIDADHKYYSVIADIKKWSPKVKIGGFVSGHDCDHRGVKRALVEVYGKNGYNTAQDQVWFVKK
jgi:predicted O-methyltransferase YrrM